MTTQTENLINEANQIIKEFDDHTTNFNTPLYPLHLYELILEMRNALSEHMSLSLESDEQRFTRFAVEELSDRLSDAVSENIRLSVQLRVASDDNQAAADNFLSEALSKYFPTKD